MKYKLKDYFYNYEEVKIYHIIAKWKVTPIDINIVSIVKTFNFNSVHDRFRFWFKLSKANNVIRIIIRVINIKRDYCIIAYLWYNGIVEIQSNDEEVAEKFLNEVFLNVPPQYIKESELDIKREWTSDIKLKLKFLGLLIGGLLHINQLPQELNKGLQYFINLLNNCKSNSSNFIKQT